MMSVLVSLFMLNFIVKLSFFVVVIGLQMGFQRTSFIS